MKYEYRTEIISKYDSSTYQVLHLDHAMTKLGSEGWELVSTAAMGQVIYGYFKREIKS